MANTRVNGEAHVAAAGPQGVNLDSWLIHIASFTLIPLSSCPPITRWQM